MKSRSRLPRFGCSTFYVSTDLDKKVSLKQYIFGHSGSCSKKKPYAYDPYTNTTGIPSLQMETPMKVDVRNFPGDPRRFFRGFPGSRHTFPGQPFWVSWSVEIWYRNCRDNMLLPQLKIVPAFKKLPVKYMGLNPQTQFTKPTWKVDGMYA